MLTVFIYSYGSVTEHAVTALQLFEERLETSSDNITRLEAQVFDLEAQVADLTEKLNQANARIDGHHTDIGTHNEILISLMTEDNQEDIDGGSGSECDNTPGSESN